MDALVRALPRRAVSRLVGVLARAELPRPLVGAAVHLYARAYGCDLAEAEGAPYGSFVSFFSRRLRAGARPLPADPAAIAAPADGSVHAAGRVEHGLVLQTKGVPYALPDLLGDADLAGRLQGGTYLATYLAPGDYHRFHWPFDADVLVVRHVPGDLWPVHPRAARTIPRLFCRNERVVVSGRLPSGAPFAWVAVGAFDVGSIRLAFLPLVTNRGGTARVRTYELDHRARRGEEAGWFELGSAFVLVVGAAGGRLDAPAAGARLLARQSVGRLAS